MFCESPLWDQNLTWNTEDPDFTTCFQKTALLWGPCLLLWLLAGPELYYVAKHKKKALPWNYINIAKLIVNLLLIVLTVLDFVAVMYELIAGYQIYEADVYSVFIKLLTFALSAYLMLSNKVHGRCTSGVLFMFWFFLACCGAFRFRTELRAHFGTGPSFNFVSYVIYYVFVLSMLLFNFFADTPLPDDADEKGSNPSPDGTSSFVSRLFFNWFNPLARVGFKKSLEVTDLWSLNPADRSADVVPRFDKHWKPLLDDFNSPRKTVKRNGRNIYVNTKRKHASIIPALWKAFGTTFLFGTFLKFIQDIMTFLSPQVLRLLIAFKEGKDPMWKGCFYAVVLFMIATVQTLLNSQFMYRMFLVGLRIRTALISAVYRKAMRLSNASRKKRTIGEIVNLMAVDAHSFMKLCVNLNSMWSAPLQLCLAVYFLWGILGPAVLAGLTLMVVLVPINAVIANKIKNFQTDQMAEKDKRVKLMNEILSGIKVLKLYAWEESFQHHIMKIRNNEVNILKRAIFANAALLLIWNCAPMLVSLVSFATYVLMDERNVLDAKTVFVSLSLFNILQAPLVKLPFLISLLIHASVSVQRLNKFMNCEELNPRDVGHDKYEKTPLIMENGYFSWGDQVVLHNMNLRLKQGSLNAVVGSVGSGKSSLINAFLGEMQIHSGKVNTHGTTAYVSQQAWIRNATLRDNILFGKPFDKQKYNRIVDACALRADFNMLPAGDQTEIGEKGINLSGGQKQRINLARAVYSDADNYFLDDPLSAVDAHVGKHIFEKIVGPKGALARKTRVFVTHQIAYLSEVDNIVVMKNGRISEMGDCKQLLSSNGDFAEFWYQHCMEVADNAVDDFGALNSEEFKHRMARRHSRISECISETSSIDRHSFTGSLLWQMSVDSSCGDRKNSLQQRILKMEDIKEPAIGERLIESERAETGKVKWSVYFYYLRSIGMPLTVGTFLMNITLQTLSVGTNVWLLKWSSDTTSKAKGYMEESRRNMYLFVYSLLGIFQAVASFFSDLLPQLGCWIAAKTMHYSMLKGIMRAPLMFFNTTPQGRILSRFAKDVDVVDSSLAQQIIDTVLFFFKVMSTLIVISSSSPQFCIVVIPIAIIYCLIQHYYISTSRQLKRLESINRSPIYSHFEESLVGAPVIRAYKLEDSFVKDSQARVDMFQKCFFPSIASNRWLAVRLEMIGNLIIFFAALFAVLGRDTMSASLAGLSISYALEITQNLNWLVRVSSDVEANIVSVERIKEYGETAPESAWRIPRTTPSNSWPYKGTVELRDYSIRYRPGLDLVLRGINADIKGGERIGIVGRTGAGKSSLTLALFRIIEAAKGKIYIDGIDISTLGLHDLRSRLTIIPQDAVLFSGTLRLNLDPFNAHSDEDIWRALEHAHLKEFVSCLQNRLDYDITEGGDNISVGQRQLICLARALLRKTKVLILDEATAAVDLETDDLIQRTIREEFKGATVLTIAHRLNTILDSDRVLVLDKGQICEFDPPAILLQNKFSVFHGMAKDAGIV